MTAALRVLSTLAAIACGAGIVVGVAVLIDTLTGPREQATGLWLETARDEGELS